MCMDDRNGSSDVSEEVFGMICTDLMNELLNKEFGGFY